MTDEQKERVEALDEAIRVLSSIAGWIHDLAPTKSRKHRREQCMHAAERLLKVRQHELVDEREDVPHCPACKAILFRSEGGWWCPREDCKLSDGPRGQIGMRRMHELTPSAMAAAAQIFCHDCDSYVSSCSHYERRETGWQRIDSSESSS